MKVFLVSELRYGRASLCRQCRRTLKPGQAVVAQEFGNNRLLWHRSCVEEVLANGPTDLKVYITEFEQLREKAKKGELFNDCTTS